MPKIVDLDELVINWAWNVIQQRKSKIFRRLEFGDLKFEVNWDRVRFLAEEPVYTDENKLEKQNSQVVFKSVYENTTGNPQEHTFQTERCTVATCKTTMTKGFTKLVYHKLDLKFTLPSKILSATAGFGRDLTIESSDESTREESIKWSINSTIRVPGRHRTVAELVVKEQQYTAAFKTTARIRGHVVVMVTNLRNNNSFLQCLEHDFSEIIKTRDDISKYFTIDEGRTVKWEVTGMCQFRYGVEQHVQLYESPLEAS
ncbi:unnamed protein product [Candidula unifasciata]|uniref:Uncharacterized protein n=1 Tax=Candidula unifasciata TaxID=100452 RepID=A0A8S3YI02_9EUPU|nr:unnamed protein product [Candidula unifasciata]